MNQDDTKTKNSLENRVMSSPKSVFVLYLIVSGNFLANLFGCRTQKALTNTMWLKHILGFMTMYFFVVLADSSSPFTDSPQMQLLFTLFCYTLFLISTRMDYKWWIAFILTLVAYYILQVYKDHTQTKEQDKEKYKTIQKYLTYVAGIILVVGFLVYLGKKKLEYKDQFNWTTFLIGKPSCTFDDSKIQMSDTQAILNAFQ